MTSNILNTNFNITSERYIRVFYYHVKTLIESYSIVLLKNYYAHAI